MGDSRSTLRQVESMLRDLGAERHSGGEVNDVIRELEGNPTGLKELVTMLVRTYTEVMEVIASLRQSRGALEQAAMERLKSTHMKLAEISSATEVAASGMLDGIDRALALVDALESAGDRGDDDRMAHVRGDLRDELHQLMGLLQFQDITSQQLGYASGVLLDIEERMTAVASLFDLAGLTGAEGDSGGVSRTAQTCDPRATTLQAVQRQALADSVFSPAGQG